MSHLRCLGMAPTVLALILVLGTVGARKHDRSKREYGSAVTLSKIDRK